MRKLVSSRRGLIAAVLFFVPIAATALEAPKDPPKPMAPVLETDNFKCYSAPALCNCTGEANCKVLQSSDKCKPGTYNFHPDAGIGTCVFQPGA